MTTYSRVGISQALFFSREGESVFAVFFVFLGLHLWHIEVPRLGVETEL